MRRLRISLVVLLAAIVVAPPPTSAQSLAFSIFERYLESLRVQAGIPGLSAAVLQNGAIVWERGFGRQDLEAAIDATPSTPYVIGDLSQTLGATLLLKKCVDESYAEVSDRVIRWDPSFPEQDTTLAHLLTHVSPEGAFRYDPSRFAALTPVAVECADLSYPVLVQQDIFGRFGMVDSVPGHALDRGAFDSDDLQRFDAVLRRLAQGYRVDRSGRAARADVTPRPATAAAGIVSTVRDLARFDKALGDGTLLSDEIRARAWTRATVGGSPLPTGLGWFVQPYNNDTLVWHFGLVDGYSSLILKVPTRNLTLILLANSDGLSAPYALHNGDVTTSVFARLFLQLLVP